MHADRQCSKCGGARTRVIAQSVSPPGEFIECQDCGHSTLTAARAPATSSPSGAPSLIDVDKRRVERLVTGCIEARRLPCRLLAVDRATTGWRISVRTRLGDSRFDVPADSVATMRGAIERALAGAS